jgi:hypothetical protein
MIRKHLRLKRIALGLAFAAIAAPVAQATPYGGSVSSQKDQAVLSTEVSAYEVVSGRTILPGGMTLASSSVVRSENSFGAPGPSAAGATGPQHVISSTSSSTFDWSDAGIGASVAFGVALMLLMAVALGRRYRGRLDRTLASA